MARNSRSDHGVDPLPADPEMAAALRAARGGGRATQPAPGAARPALSTVPDPAGQRPAAGTTPLPVAPRPPVADAEPGYETAAGGTQQATVLISSDVRARFTAYRKARAGSGPMPTNTQVVFAALNDCAARYRQIVASKRPTPNPAVLFGSEYVPGRRTTTEARPSTQLSFRLTPRERAALKAQADAADASSVSAFVDAVLDDWLPQGRRRARS
jgi:hypothetical protein